MSPDPLLLSRHGSLWKRNARTHALILSGSIFLLLLLWNLFHRQLCALAHAHPGSAWPTILLDTLAVTLLVAVPVLWFQTYFRRRTAQVLEGISLDAQRSSAEVEMFQRLCDEAAIVAVTDAEGMITYANNAMCRISGYSHGELIGQNHQILNSGTHPRSFWTRMYRTVLTGHPWRAEVCSCRKDGTLYWVDTTIVADLDDRGRPERFFAFCLDVTEQRHAHTEVSRLALAVDSAAEAIVITDPEGRIVYVNPAFERITGYSRVEAVGDRSSILKSGKQDEAFYRALWTTISSGNLWTGSFVNMRKDGSLYEEVATIAPVKDESGRIVNYVAIKRDVTQERDLEAQLHQAQKLESVGRLAAGIAHEINTPMQYIGDSTRYLSRSFHDVLTVVEACRRSVQVLESLPDHKATAAEIQKTLDDAVVEFANEEIPSAIARVLGGVERVSEIVRAMREFAHPQSKEKTAADINQLITTALTVSRNEYKLVASVTTRFSDLPLVMCHVGELNQVFLNLIVNAAHALAEVFEEKGPGEITITTSADEDWVVIEISDTGPGIPDAIRDKVFDPFFTTKAVGKGTGQGLAIARATIVEKHGGTLKVRSVLGEGTTFTMRLPVHVDVEPAEEDNEAHSLCR